MGGWRRSTRNSCRLSMRAGGSLPPLSSWQQRQHLGLDLNSQPSGVGNIYETVDLPTTTTTGGRRPSSVCSSTTTSRLAGQTRLREHYDDNDDDDEQQQQENQQLLLVVDDCFASDQNDKNYQLGRRNPNAAEEEEEENNKEGEGYEGSQAADGHTGEGHSNRRQTLSEMYRQPADVCGHYQVPSRQVTGSTVSDELNELIETKRKRTLMMLKAKEAPRASFELVSPVEPEHLGPPAPIDEGGPKCGSPSNGSHYENLHLDEGGAVEEDEQPDCDRHPQLKADHSNQQVIVRDNSVVSPSESQNFNTLSMASDVLGDLSQEESSLVQQLGPN